MSPHAKRLWSAMREQRNRRTVRFYRHHACLTSTRAVDAVDELVALGEIKAVGANGNPVDRFREGAEGLLVELNHRGRK